MRLKSSSKPTRSNTMSRLPFTWIDIEIEIEHEINLNSYRKVFLRGKMRLLCDNDFKHGGDHVPVWRLDHKGPVAGVVLRDPLQLHPHLSVPVARVPGILFHGPAEKRSKPHLIRQVSGLSPDPGVRARPDLFFQVASPGFIHMWAKSGVKKPDWWLFSGSSSKPMRSKMISTLPPSWEEERVDWFWVDTLSPRLGWEALCLSPGEVPQWQ